VRKKLATLSKEEIIRYWFLTSAIEFPRGLSYFFPAVDGLALNMPDPSGCKPEDYAHALLSLYDLGLIEFSSQFSGDDVTAHAGISSILDSFLIFTKENPTALLNRRVRRDNASGSDIRRSDLVAHFKLTSSGGEAWEQIANPDWQKFYGQLNDSQTAEITSADLNTLIMVLGWFRELSGVQPVSESIRISTLVDHPILYWKILPKVFHAEFAVTATEGKWSVTNGKCPKWFRDWWVSHQEWFTQPWELPGWPSQ
jgi:hypothetical protein